MFGLAILFGVMVGFALGLTGSGGGVFAVPLLVYGLRVAPREAVGVSLASVGATALLGVLPRLKRRDVEITTGIVMALGGIAGAPVGTQLAKLVGEHVLLLLFGGLMLLIAVQMWHRSMTRSAPRQHSATDAVAGGAWCSRQPDGRLNVTVPCVVMLALLGFATGVLSGMFGVGGGFVIVPALVLLSGMSIHHAVGTSLMVIVLISISGVSSYLRDGGHLSLQLTLLFIVGGFLGMQLGTRLSRYLSGAMLQRVFAAAVLLMAVFVIFKSTLSTGEVHRASAAAAVSFPGLSESPRSAGATNHRAGCLPCAVVHWTQPPTGFRP